MILKLNLQVKENELKTCLSTKDAKLEEAPTDMYTRQRERMGESVTSKASSQNNPLSSLQHT